MFILNNKPLPIDVPFEHEGIQYPANWLRLTSLEDKQAIGIIEVPDPAPLDYRLYEAEGVLRDIEEVRAKLIRQYRDEAKYRLNTTDWYVIRKMERSIEIPSDIIDERNSILSKLDALTSELETAATVSDLYVAVDKFVW